MLIVLIVVILLIALLCAGYVKAPPDMAFIISGIKKKSKIVIGKASIRIPFFERLDKLNLRLIPPLRPSSTPYAPEAVSIRICNLLCGAGQTCRKSGQCPRKTRFAIVRFVFFIASVLTRLFLYLSNLFPI